MIIIGVLIALFVLFFILKKHVGTAILASFAGAIVFETINGFYVTLHKLTGVPLGVIENVAFTILVLVLPFIIYFFSKHSWSPVPLRVFASIISAILIVSLCSGFIRSLISLDSLSSNILGFIIEYRGIISTIAIIVAYFDVILPHKE